MVASNFLGQIFRITTWGESHGKAMGVVIDGCPSGISLCEEDINIELYRRKGGMSTFTTPRSEEDRAEILSGIFEGQTTGSPISIIIPNKNFDPSKYEPIKDVLRPGHANFTYMQKYGIFDHRGGGRASARETVCRVAAGAVAKKLLKLYGIEHICFMRQIGNVTLKELPSIEQSAIYQSPVLCPDKESSQLMEKELENAMKDGDSLGGIIELHILNIPAGIGDPVYEKIQANLAKAMLSIPACKGVEFGTGFAAGHMKGSEHNDLFALNDYGSFYTTTNNCGGILAGITNGMPITLKIAMKPTSSIKISQKSLTFTKESTTLTLPEGSRHDPCVAIRAVPVVEAMAALVIADSILLSRTSKI